MEPQETDDPSKALEHIYGWLMSGGPHFTGGWSLDPNVEKKEHRATLGMRALPKDLHSPIRTVIRLSAEEVGWMAKHIKITHNSVEFVLRHYPAEARAADLEKRESFRQAARETLVRMRPGQSDDRTPEP